MKKHPDPQYAIGSRQYAARFTFHLSRFLLPAMLLLLLLLSALPAAAANKVMPFDPAGLASLAGAIPAPTPTSLGAAPAPTLAPVPQPASEGLTLDRFAIGFGLVAIGALGAALAMRALRNARATVSAQSTEKKSPPPG